MQGILDFKSSSTEGNFRLYRRANATRTKSGCLSCRTRHTKCDEERPVCNACIRNHLLCSWPRRERTPESRPPFHLSQSSLSPVQISFPQPCPSRSLSSWPRLQDKPAEQRLLHYYMERSVLRLIIRDKGHNPFLSYMLPLAQHNDGFLHILIAIGASHLAFDDPAVHFSALSHYAVALRAVKYLITQFGNGCRDNSLEILLLLVALCAFEIFDGNTDGAVMHHWGSCSAVLLSQTALLRKIDDGYARFVAEQYMFIGLVNEYLGLVPPSQNGGFSPKPMLDLSSYYRERCSSCAYGLFEMIPQIASLANKPSEYCPRYLDPDIITEFHALEQRILSWTVPTAVDCEPGYSSEPNEDELRAAIVQQLALLMTLQCALNGPGVPHLHIKTQIESCILEATNLMRRISPDSAAWGMLLWAFAHIGSCILSEETRHEFVSVLRGIKNQVPGCAKFISVLEKLWEASGAEGRFYGPYGIREFMSRERIKPSLG